MSSPARCGLFPAGGGDRIGWVATPGGFVCGTDFCNECGDCLACFGGDYCPSGFHRPVVYEDDLEEYLTEHEGATVERLDGGA